MGGVPLLGSLSDMEKEAYEAIDDWSLAARRALFEREEARVRRLLDESFTDFYDELELHTFGFNGADPVADAVEWCVKRWCSDPPIDPGKLYNKSRSFRLFTQPRWWLAQKVTKAGLHARTSRTREPLKDLQADGSVAIITHSAADSDEKFDASRPVHAAPRSSDHARAVDDEMGAMSVTLSSLARQTCADLVAYWLDGTEALRAEFMGWAGASSLPDGVRDDRASRYRHDAMFRFQVLARQRLLVPSELPTLAVRATMLEPCRNAPPYRRADREVLPSFHRQGCRGPRDVTHLRKEGSRRLLTRLIEGYQDMMRELTPANSPRALEGVQELREGIRALFLKKTLHRTLLYALGIEGSQGLAARLSDLHEKEGVNP
jgi:hypothetical protein